MLMVASLPGLPHPPGVKMTRLLSEVPRVGIGIMVIKDHKILLGKRMGSHGSGEFSLPGGHLEHLEGFESCARREVFEECDLQIKDIEFVCLTNIRHFAPKHYVNIGFVSAWERGVPTVKEPDKCEAWNWYALDCLPSPLFFPTQVVIDKYMKKIHYQDAEDLEHEYKKTMV